MRTVVDTDALKISIVENESDSVTLCFTGIGNAVGGIDIQSEEFFRSSHRSTALFIIDKHRSWGNSVDFSTIKTVVDDLGPSKTVNAIGNSMGGFLAILATRFMAIDHCIAIVPQFSVDRRIVPGEHRWDAYVDRIGDWRYPHLGDAFNDSTLYYILAGVGGADDRHLRRFAPAQNVHKIYFRNPALNHNVAQVLKERGVIYDVIGDCFAGRSAAEIISDHLAGPHYRAFQPVERPAPAI